MFRVCLAGGSSPMRRGSVDIIAGSFEYAFEGVMVGDGKAVREPGDAMNEWKADASQWSVEWGTWEWMLKKNIHHAMQRNAARHDVFPVKFFLKS